MTESQGIKFDFDGYVNRRVTEDKVSGSDSYAYSGDLKVLRTMRKLVPVKLAVETMVRFFNSFYRNELLGSAVLVTPKQFPKIHELGLQCANTLGLPEQQIYIIQGLGAINAMTTGTDRESLVIIYSATVDHLTEEELLYVIGHEFGHIQNSHAVYMTTLYLLTKVVEGYISRLALPAILALQHWSRRAEITADRAGLLCCRDVAVAQRASAKIALGSKELYEQLDMDEYLKQLEKGRENLSRIREIGQSHPYMPKRVESLRLFAESSYYRKHIGLDGGLDKATVDFQVSKILKIL
jgi:Zn-dependent protease with chaperone function